MKYSELAAILEAVEGCTFASIDAITTPCKGVSRVVTGESVILFTNKASSGYENMVKKRLEECGKDAANFVLGDLPWGTRISGTPFIAHKGKHYLQTVLLKPGVVRYYLGERELTPEQAIGFLPRSKPNQGLPDEKKVIVQTYDVENITKIAAMGAVYEDRARTFSAAPKSAEGLCALRHPTQQDDDDGALEVWAVAKMKDGKWVKEGDVTGAGQHAMEAAGFKVVPLAEFNSLVKVRETLRLRQVA